MEIRGHHRNKKMLIFLDSCTIKHNKISTPKNYFLRGYIDDKLFGSEVVENVERKYIRVPGSENIVIVYDQTQENRYQCEKSSR
jgi:hypothetical protein